MNWLNSNMHSDDSDTDASQSDTNNTTNDINRSYLCLVCDQNTTQPIFNKVQSCLQCPHCNRSWCLQDSLNKKKCPNLDLIQKRYLEIKFSKYKRNHHMTNHALAWIGTNILGNLGNINDTFDQINLARNTQQPTLETIRAQQRFGIHDPNVMKYHPTHPVIIGSLPKLNIHENKTHQLLLKHNACPICQLQFIDDGIQSTDDELDELLSSDNDQIATDTYKSVQVVHNKNDNNENETKEEENMFKLMKSNQLNNNNTNIINTNNNEMKTEQIGNIVNLYNKQLQTKLSNPKDKNNINIGKELIASNDSHKTMNITVNGNNNSTQNDDFIVNEWKPEDDDHKTEQNEEKLNEEKLNENENENENEETVAFEIKKCDKNEIDTHSIVRLWCGHLFHNDCVIPWLVKQNTCPLCRYELPSNNPSYELQRRAETYNNHAIYQVMT